MTHTRACHKWLSFDSLIYRLSSLQTDLHSNKDGEHRWVYERKSTFVLPDEAMELQPISRSGIPLPLPNSDVNISKNIFFTKTWFILTLTCSL